MTVHLLQVVKPLNICPLELSKLVNILQKQLGLEGAFHQNAILGHTVLVSTTWRA